MKKERSADRSCEKELVRLPMLLLIKATPKPLSSAARHASQLQSLPPFWSPPAARQQKRRPLSIFQVLIAETLGQLLRLVNANECQQAAEYDHGQENHHTGDEIPAKLDGHEVAKAYYGIINQNFQGQLAEGLPLEDWFSDIALAVDEIIERNRIVQWADNQDIQNRMLIEIEDWLFEFANQKGFE